MNFNPHDGEKKPKLEESEKTACDCIVCGFRELLVAKYPVGPNDEDRVEIRLALARIVGTLMAGASVEEQETFEQEMNRVADVIEMHKRMKAGLTEMFGESAVIFFL